MKKRPPWPPLLLRYVGSLLRSSNVCKSTQVTLGVINLDVFQSGRNFVRSAQGAGMPIAYLYLLRSPTNAVPWAHPSWKHPCDHHVGVPSCGQQAATTSVTHICFIRYPIAQALFQGPRRYLRLVSGPPKIFFSPPTRSYLFFYTTSTPNYSCLHTPCVHLYPVEEVRWRGFILPSPLSFAPQRSRPTVDFFGAPHRLPARTRIKYLLANCETSARRNTFRPSKGSQLDKPQTTLSVLDRCGLVVTDSAWFIMWELGCTKHDEEESYVYVTL
jgi:hypothetical protein